jgi:hypothetical protein
VKIIHVAFSQGGKKGTIRLFFGAALAPFHCFAPTSQFFLKLAAEPSNELPMSTRRKIIGNCGV